eukprot:508518-Hanusia_phi.AAC.5
MHSAGRPRAERDCSGAIVSIWTFASTPPPHHSRPLTSLKVEHELLCVEGGRFPPPGLPRA